MSELLSFLWPNNILLHGYTTFCLSFCLFMDIWVVSTSTDHTLIDTDLEAIGSHSHQFTYLKDHSACCMENGLQKETSGNKNDSWEATALKAREIGGLN